MRRLLAFLLACACVASAQQQDGLNAAYVKQRDAELRGASKELLALGEWARKNTLFFSARRAYETVLLLSPDDAESKKWLGSIDPDSPIQEAPAGVKAYEARRLDIVKRHAKALEELGKWADKAKLQAEADDARAFSKKLDVPSTAGLSADEKTVLTDINRFRNLAGLGLVSADHKLSAASDSHAKYLVKNAGAPSTAGLGAHKEDPKLPGYTQDGERAGGASDICFQAAAGSVDAWMATLYHRIPILHPQLRRFGCGFEQGGSWGWVGVLDLLEGHDSVPCDPAVVRYPARGQDGVPTAFGGEIPDPVKGGSRGCGYPVTLTFYDGSKVTLLSSKLSVDGGAEVPCHVSSPDAPATDFPQQDTICLIPKAALKAATTYSVEIHVKHNGKEDVESWKFKTK